MSKNKIVGNEIIKLGHFVDSYNPTPNVNPLDHWAIQLNFSVTRKLCLATATHNFKWLKIYVICAIYVPTYLSVAKLKAYFIFNNWLCRF